MEAQPERVGEGSRRGRSRSGSEDSRSTSNTNNNDNNNNGRRRSPSPSVTIPSTPSRSVMRNGISEFSSRVAPFSNQLTELGQIMNEVTEGALTSGTLDRLYESLREADGRSTSNPNNNNDNNNRPRRSPSPCAAMRSTLPSRSVTRNRTNELLSRVAAFSNQVTQLSQMIGEVTEEALSFRTRLDTLNEAPPQAENAAPNIEQLPSITILEEHISDINSNTSSCPVCMDPFHLGEEARQLPCRHIFHDPCIFPWLQGRLTCPLCRSQIPTSTKSSSPSN